MPAAVSMMPCLLVGKSVLLCSEAGHDVTDHLLMQSSPAPAVPQVDMTLPLPAALAPEPAAMPLLDTEDSFADILLEDIGPTGNLAGVRPLLLSLLLQAAV